MKVFKRFLLVVFTLTIFSCEGSTQTLSREFKSFLLKESDVPAASVNKRLWRVVSDTEDALPVFRKSRRTVYKIRYPHDVDNVAFPDGSEVCFEGGSIKGKVTFNNNYLSGDVRLHDSKLNGTITNQQFEAGWACYGDSLHDDAFGINQILRICKTIHFQRGTYLMELQHQIPESFPAKYRKKVLSHIGIYQSGVHLIGDEGACIYTKDTLKTVCIYSKPKELDHSVGDIVINGLTFRNVNDGQKFYEFEHTIKVAGVDGLEISNCQFFDFRGDAISLSHLGNSVSAGELSRNSNVKIVGNYLEGASHNNRNGISVISGQKVTICNNYIEHTSKSNMPGAIDVEANNSAFTVDEIRITNNYIKDSKGSGGAISIVSERDAPARNIVINSNIIEDTKCGIFIKIDSRYTTDGFDIQKNQLSNVDIPILVKGAGCSNQWTVRDNSFEFTRKQLKRVNVDNIKCK